MGNAINAICLVLVAILGIAVYVFIISTVFPKFILKIRCSFSASRDRGLKKYVYPSGRGVVYEPYPTLRKYVDRYVLFTHEGYKYLKCHLTGNIGDVNYSIVMFNNKNEVVDVIDVNERVSGDETDAVLLHHETSYISLILNRVNQTSLNSEAPYYCKRKSIFGYGAAVTLLSFFELLAVWLMLIIFDNLIIGSGFFLELGIINVLFFALFSLLIGVIAAGIAYHCIRARGVRWSK